MLPSWVLGVAAGVGAAAGLLIGSVGVGGIILVPSLIQMKDHIEIQTAIASCMFSYIFAGLVGAASYIYKKSVNWRSTAWLVVGAAPGSFAGAFVLQYIENNTIKLVLYSVILLSAFFSIWRTIGSRPKGDARSQDGGEKESVDEAERSMVDQDDDTHEGSDVEETEGSEMTYRGILMRLVIGVVVGFGSTLTGSSGPVLLLPILIILRWDILESLGSAQVIQIPISIAATVSYATLREDTIDYGLGLSIAGGLTPCVIAGAAIAHKVPRHILKIVVSVVLLVASITLLTKLIVEEFA